MNRCDCLIKMAFVLSKNSSPCCEIHVSMELLIIVPSRVTQEPSKCPDSFFASMISIVKTPVKLLNYLNNQTTVLICHSEGPCSNSLLHISTFKRFEGNSES